jgi:hypothetical protein
MAGVTLLVLAVIVVLASVPYWLPALVVALRTRLFVAINGQEGLPIPGDLVPPSEFKRVYSHPAADGRSRGAKLSDLFWYWLAPGPELHQEHLEPGPRYEEVAKTTKRMLKMSKQESGELVASCVGRALSRNPETAPRLVRLRDFWMPIWAEFYYEIVFHQPCPDEARKLIFDNANDVVTALKCCGLRHMDRRERLTRYLVDKLEAGELPEVLPAFSLEERALYLQGVYFNTAVVQMSEAMTHLMLVIAEHGAIQRRLLAGDEPGYLDRVILEVLRVYPLFGISHRIASDEIVLDERTRIPAGAVLCFDHARYHRHGFDDPERVEPDRWIGLAAKEASYIPFGVAANRPCPAQGIALATMRVAAGEMLKRYRLASSARHTRSVPNRGPCLLIPRATRYPLWRQKSALVWLRFRDRWEDVSRSLLQLVLGTYMVRDARRKRLCERYFEEQKIEE